MKNRTTDYRFDVETMVKFEGNAGPYLQYQVARTRSIFEKAEREWPTSWGAIELGHEQEAALAKVLLRFGEVVHKAAETCQPHLLCDHVYEVARAFSRFYDQCQVLNAEGETREHRLGLTWLTGRQLETGLQLLGIEVLDRM